MIIKRALFSKYLLDKYLELFNICFPDSRKFSHKYLKWLYTENPDGDMIGYNAYDGEKLIGHYGCIPAKFIINSKHESGLLSLNTAIHPDYQGKGLFITLAKRTYDSAIKENYTFVYGVSNAKSTYGFTNKLGFQLVKPLDVLIGIGNLNIDWNKSNTSAEFYRLWSENALKWRCSNPNNLIRISSYKDYSIFRSDAVKYFIDSVAYLPIPYKAFNTLIINRNYVNLFIGLFPDRVCTPKLFIRIPDFLKPSPLNLIYRNLKDKSHKLNPDEIFFSYLDFDAY